MASASDVRYAQLQYEENRKLGEGIRKQQDSLDQKRGRMGWGRLIGSTLGTAAMAASGPIGWAIGAGVGSALGSLAGAKSTKIDEVDKGKLYKGTVDEVRRQGRGALEQMNQMALRGIASDAFSAFAFAGTDMGKAMQSGAQGKVAALGSLAPDATLLQKAMHGGKQAIASGTGAFSGGVGHVRAGIANAMRPEATTPVIPELTELEGGFGGDYLQEGLPGRVSTKFGSPGTPLLSPEQIQATEQAMESGLAPWQAAETAPWSSASDIAGNDISTKLTIPMAEGKPSSSLNLFNQDIRYSGDLASTASDATSLPTQLANIAQDNATRTTVPLADAMKQYQGPQFAGPGSGIYDPSLDNLPQHWGTWSPAQAQQYDMLAELKKFQATRDPYGRAIAP